MPTISSFYGILISMYFNDHPPAHFHARYGEYTARVAIDSGKVIGGRLPPNADRLVRQWAGLNRASLAGNWRCARELRPLEPIEPLR